MPQIMKRPFGNTGHLSTRVIFGAAAFFVMRRERAEKILKLLLQYGINHIDVAADYGDAELRIGEWMDRYRNHFFIATKTSDRTAAGAKQSIQRSLQRLKVDRIDMIQLHNLVDENEWHTALGPNGALEALIEARDKGIVRFIGVTGHGITAPAMHLKSLMRFDFDSVLLPLNYILMQNNAYAADFKTLLDVCRKRNVAVQTIKSIARRRWLKDDTQKHFSWYEPLKHPDALQRAVQWVLSEPHVFLNTSSDTTLLPRILEAALQFDSAKRNFDPQQMATDVLEQEMVPIFDANHANPF